MTTPFHALVPFGAQREPGLIISSNIGQIKFWDSIAMGLAGGDNYTFLLLGLQESENVTSLTRADVRTRIISVFAHTEFLFSHLGTNIHRLDLNRSTVPTTSDFGRREVSLVSPRLQPAVLLLVFDPSTPGFLVCPGAAATTWQHQCGGRLRPRSWCHRTGSMGPC